VGVEVGVEEKSVCVGRESGNSVVEEGESVADN